MSNVDKEVTEYAGSVVDSVLQNIMDVLDVEEMTKCEYETFVTMLQDRIENLPEYSELYD